MSAIIHLQYLPAEANVTDIRQFFYPLQIPEGGVRIVGPEHDDAYIVFNTIDDARRAIQKNGDLICQYPVTLSICSHIEMPFHDIGENQNVVAPIEEQYARQDSTEAISIGDIYNDAVYFLIKSAYKENIDISKAEDVWSTTPSVENKLDRAFREHRNVILIFSNRDSRAFQGYARMAHVSRPNDRGVRWMIPPCLRNMGFPRVIEIDWINRQSLSFNKTPHLNNPFNENQPVQEGPDGQIIEPRCAKALCDLFPYDRFIDIMSIAIKAKHSKKRYSPQCASRSSLPSKRRRPNDDNDRLIPYKRHR